MKQVTQKEYYDFIGPKDCISIILDTPFPYTREQRMRHSGEVIAKSVDTLEDGVWPIITTYFIKIS